MGILRIRHFAEGARKSLTLPRRSDGAERRQYSQAENHAKSISTADGTIAEQNETCKRKMMALCDQAKTARAVRGD
jgi:hypothetical protein